MSTTTNVDTKVIAKELVKDLQKVAWEIWILSYLCVLLPSWQFIVRKYVEFRLDEKMRGLLVKVKGIGKRNAPVLTNPEAEAPSHSHELCSCERVRACASAEETEETPAESSSQN